MSKLREMTTMRTIRNHNNEKDEKSDQHEGISKSPSHEQNKTNENNPKVENRGAKL